MIYLVALPSLVCGLMVGGEDIRRRRVPRAWIAAGCAVQCAANIAYGVACGRPWMAMACVAYAVVAAGLQLLLALVRPGALGFGDVTATLLVGQAVGLFGVVRFALWWLAMGAVGLLWIWLWRWFGAPRQPCFGGRTPFVPAIVLSAVLAVL